MTTEAMQAAMLAVSDGAAFLVPLVTVSVAFALVRLGFLAVLGRE